MPGRLLHRFAMACFSRETLDHVIEPLLADLQREWSDAQAWRRGLVRGRGYVAFWIAVGWCCGRAVARDLTRSPSSAERMLGAQLGAWIAFALALGASASWVRFGAISPDAVLQSLRYGPALAIVPALILARYRALISGTTFGCAALTAVTILALGCCAWEFQTQPHFASRFLYALILVIVQLARPTAAEGR
jgi:hypothetical protein